MKLEVRSHEVRSKKSEVTKLEIGSHEVRNKKVRKVMKLEGQMSFQGFHKIDSIRVFISTFAQK